MRTTFTPFFPAWLHVLGPMGPRLKNGFKAVQALTLNGLEGRLGAYLPGDLLTPPAAKQNSRERIFPLGRTFFCWIWQMLQLNSSCREVVRQVQALFALRGGGPVDEHTSAYCQARTRLPQQLLQKALGASAMAATQRAPRLALLQSRRLKAVDGTGLRAPDTPANQERYPQPSNQKSGCGFPVVRLVSIFCVASGVILAQCTGSLLQPELSLFYSLFSQLQKGDILIGDRAFGNFVVLALLSRIGVDFIGRVPIRIRKVDFRQGQRLGPYDCLLCWTKGPHPSRWLGPWQWESLAQSLTVRIVRTRISIKGFRVREMTLVTTLLDARLYPKEQILAAYLRRWQLELCLRDLKATLGLRDLKCLSPDMLQKELLVGLLMHNLLRCVMAEAAQTQNAQLERISFKGSLDALRQFSAAMAQTRSIKKCRQLWQTLLQTLANDLVPHRPARREPRAVKRRPKYPRLNKPRHNYVDRWSRNKRRRVSRAKNNNEPN